MGGEGAKGRHGTLREPGAATLAALSFCSQLVATIVSYGPDVHI